MSNLVCASDQTEIVFAQELIHDVSTERIRHPAVIVTPASDVLAIQRRLKDTSN